MLDSLIGAANHADVLLFYFINLNLQNPYFNFLMPIITNLGLYIFWFGICAVLAVFGGEKGRDVALILFITLLIGHIFSEALKYLFLRPRPFEVLSGVHQLSTHRKLLISIWPCNRSICRCYNYWKKVRTSLAVHFTCTSYLIFQGLYRCTLPWRCTCRCIAWSWNNNDSSSFRRKYLKA